MRVGHPAFVLGMIVACSGERFTTSADAQTDRGTASVAGGGNGPSSPGSIDGVTAGTRAAPDEARGGSPSTEVEPASAGAAGALGGAAIGGEAGAPTTPECLSAASASWELGYFPELREATTNESHPFFQVTNHGEITTLDRIAIRYYFTNESNVVETGACYWVTGDRCSLAKLEFGDVPTPAARASRYLEVSFPDASNVTVAAESLEVRVGFNTGSELLVQTNDYSFDAEAAAPSSDAPFPYKRWLRATLYVDGALVWGAEPCGTTATTR